MKSEIKHRLEKKFHKDKQKENDYLIRLIKLILIKNDDNDEFKKLANLALSESIENQKLAWFLAQNYDVVTVARIAIAIAPPLLCFQANGTIFFHGYHTNQLNFSFPLWNETISKIIPKVIEEVDAYFEYFG